MAEGSFATRAEPTIGPVPSSSERPTTDLAIGETLVVRPAHEPVGYAAPAQPAAPASSPSEALLRVEEKTARIEDKLSRFEANNQRVVDRLELASARMGEVARQEDLLAVRKEVATIAARTRNLPGLSALVATALVTALLAAILTAVVLRYLPGYLPR